MIICITGNFPIYDKFGNTGKTEFVVFHGYNIKTGRNVILPCEHPTKIGAVYDEKINEWIIK